MICYKTLIRYFACLAGALTILYLLPMTCWSGLATIQDDTPVNSSHVDSEILVRCKDGVSQAEAGAILSGHGLKIAKSYTWMGNLFNVSLRPGLTVEAAIEALKAEPSIDYAEPNYIVEFDSACPTPCIPNDPEYISQWGLANIQAEGAWAATQGSPDVVVAVLDSGIDYNHPDLAENIWVNPTEIPGNGIDDDGDGYIDDVYGFNAVTDTCSDTGCLHPAGDPLDDDTSVLGHGTRLAGIIGAVGNNDLGITGVNWHVKLMPIKIRYEPDRQSSVDLVLAGMDYLITKRYLGVNIPLAQVSFSISNYSLALQSGIDAVRDAGILLIWSAGNDGINVDSNSTAFFSHVYDNVLSVGAINSSNTLPGFSNYGQVGIQLAAPGVGILSTVRSVYTPQYQTDDGTSYSAPFVAGVAALLSAYDPTISYTGLKARIISATTREDGLVGKVSSGGRLNAAGVFSAPITDLRPAGYELARIEVNQKYYTDRTFTVTGIPEGFDRLWWVRTKNNDKANTDANFINIGLSRNAIVYVAYDPRPLSVPNWLSSGQGWTDTGLSIGVTDTAAGKLRIYSKQFSPGMVVLGGNLAAGYVGPTNGYISDYVVLIRLTDVPPMAPTGFNAADVPGDNGGAISLTWTPSVSGDVAQQRVYRATLSGGPYSLITTITDNITGSYTDTGLINGTTYYYVIRAFNGTDESANSNEASAAPLDNNSPVILKPAGYELALVAVNQTYYTDRTFTVTGIPEGFDGLWWVRTKNNDKANTDANFINIGLSRDAIVYVAYDPRPLSVPNWLSFGQGWTDTGLSIGVTDTAAGKLRIYSKQFSPGMVVLGGNQAAGYVGPPSGFSSNYVVLIRLTDVPPIQPTGLSAADVPGDNGGAISLTWTPSVSGDVAQQRVYRATLSGGPYSLIMTITDNITGSYIDTGLINGTTYYYVIRAFNGTDESANSNEASAAPLDNTTAPVAPTMARRK
jgi:fibronectin type 3 domain-containing protein